MDFQEKWDVCASDTVPHFEHAINNANTHAMGSENEKAAYDMLTI